MAKKVEVYFDYMCPFCYVGLSYLAQEVAAYPDIELVYKSVEAHPRTEPAMDLGDRLEEWSQRMREMMEKANLPYNTPLNPIPRSDKAFWGMLYLQERGFDLEEYHANLFRKAFVESSNIEDIDVILSCADGYLIDQEDFRNALLEGRYEKVQQDALVTAYITNKIEYVPTLISGKKRLDAKAGVGLTKESIGQWLATL